MRAVTWKKEMQLRRVLYPRPLLAIFNSFARDTHPPFTSIDSYHGLRNILHNVRAARSSCKLKFIRKLSHYLFN